MSEEQKAQKEGEAKHRTLRERQSKQQSVRAAERGEPIHGAGALD